MFTNFVNALNSVHGQIWLLLLAIFGMTLWYLRQRQLAPAQGNFTDSLNSVNTTAWGAVICLSGIVLALAGHESLGDKVFLSGASFIGGGIHAARQAANGNGNGNGANKAPEIH